MPTLLTDRDAAPADPVEAVERPETPLSPGHVRALLARFPAWAWLALIVSMSALQLASFGKRVPAPWILPDELIYAELARSFAESGELAIRGVTGGGFSSVYSVLIAPAYALTRDPVAGYEAAKLINAFLFSLAAIPAYALGRRVLSQGWSLVLAALAVALPSSAYATVLMTENAFYPVFLAFALALTSALERPTRARQTLVVALLLFAYLTRAQAVVLVPGILLAVAMHAGFTASAATERRAAARSVLIPFWPTFALLGVGGASLAVRQLVSGAPLRDALGPYAGAVQSYSLTDTATWFVYHLAELGLYLGVAPFAVLPVVVALTMRGRLAAGMSAVVATTLALSACLLALAAAVASRRPHGHVDIPPLIHERYVFYVAPLFLMLTLTWVSRGMPRPRRLAVAGALLAAPLPAIVPFDELGHVASESLAAIPWTLYSGSTSRVVLVVLAALVAAAVLTLPRRAALVIPLLLAVNFLGIRLFAVANSQSAAETVLSTSITRERDWIDAAVGDDADVSVLWIGGADDAQSDHVGPGSRDLFERLRRVWLNEFFNSSVKSVYYVGAPMIPGLPSHELTRDTTGVLRDIDGRPVSTEFVLAPADVGVGGSVIARDQGTGMSVYRTEEPLRLTSPSD